MKKSIRFALMSVLLLAAYVLSACAGATSQTTGVSKGAKVRAEVVFTGAVEAIGGNQWTIKGQVVTVDAKTALDPNIKLGYTVKVEGHLGQDGALVAAKIESSVSDDPDVFSTPSPDVNGTPDASSTSDPAASSTPDLSATGTPRALDDDKNEFFGTINSVDFSRGLVPRRDWRGRLVLERDATTTVRTWDGTQELASIASCAYANRRQGLLARGERHQVISFCRWQWN